MPDCINFCIPTNDKRKHEQRLKGCFNLKKFSALILFVCAIVGLAGCQNNQNNNDGTNITDISYKNEKTKTPNEIARHLVDVANSVPDVNDATALVIGQYAIVGIDVNKDLDRSRVGTIKYTVSEALKNDPYSVNAIVTADTDITERIRKVQQHMQNGRPVEGILEELSEIVNRLMPEAPGALTDDDVQTPENTNDRQLNKREERDLKKQQNRQNLDNK